MNVDIRDSETLFALEPSDVSTYLKATGWHVQDDMGSLGQVMTLTQDTEEFEVFVPLSRMLRDYTLRMRELLPTLEAVEGRSQLSILTDLATTHSDVIRSSIENDSTAEGSISFEDGISYLTHAKELLVAAACSAVNPKPFYAPKKPEAVNDYLRKVRLGQTERGSYVVTILSKLPLHLTLAGSEVPDLDAIPFERKVTQKLMQGLSASLEAAQNAVSNGDLAPFKESIPRGVSANLCLAIAGMAMPHGNPNRVQIQISWSKAWRLLGDLPHRVQFESEQAEVLQAAGKLLKEISPKEGVSLTGLVIGLQRNETEKSGKVTALALVDDVAHKVQINLSEDHYNRAIQAHRQRLAIQCTGDLLKEGRSYELRNPSDFRVIGEDQLELID